ncbi:hypothetical protein J4216_04365 [Candidatus Woesearchaeota archaeon]|nr:hypothetical protein [Candidatus Woesearchaeota archaeon]
MQQHIILFKKPNFGNITTITIMTTTILITHRSSLTLFVAYFLMFSVFFWLVGDERWKLLIGLFLGSLFSLPLIANFTLIGLWKSILILGLASIIFYIILKKLEKYKFNINNKIFSLICIISLFLFLYTKEVKSLLLVSIDILITIFVIFVLILNLIKKDLNLNKEVLIILLCSIILASFGFVDQILSFIIFQANFFSNFLYRILIFLIIPLSVIIIEGLFYIKNKIKYKHIFGILILSFILISSYNNIGVIGRFSPSNPLYSGIAGPQHYEFYLEYKEYENLKQGMALIQDDTKILYLGKLPSFVKPHTNNKIIFIFYNTNYLGPIWSDERTNQPLIDWKTNLISCFEKGDVICLKKENINYVLIDSVYLLNYKRLYQNNSTLPDYEQIFNSKNFRIYKL